jgi:hypothetical protein
MNTPELQELKQYLDHKFELLTQHPQLLPQPDLASLPVFIPLGVLRSRVIDLSRKFLDSRIASGELVLGKHYVIVSNHHSPQQEKRWNWHELIKLYGTDPATRKQRNRTSKISQRLQPLSAQ